MAKFYGLIGFGEAVETAPGVWEDSITERPYFGDVLRNSRRLQTTDRVNDNLNISNEISIVADPYAMKNFHSMRYVTYMNTKWKVSNVTVQYPRLVLTIGDLFHGAEGGV
jgi:hypothetical protein